LFLIFLYYHGKFKNINPVKVDKTTLTWKRVSYPTGFRIQEAVLGAMMIDKKGVDDADILSPEAFYKEAHKHIF
jgi:replicative DNA helicase